MPALFKQTSATRKARKLGRKKGSRNKGFFWRKDRGCWCAVDGKSSPMLRDERGNKLDDPTDKPGAERAYRRWLEAQELVARDRPNQLATPIETICQMFLERCERETRTNTFNKWADNLFDFCEGAPARFRTKWAGMDNHEKAAARAEARKLSEAGGRKYVGPMGDLLVADLKIYHVTAWLNSHAGWLSEGTKRTARTALKQAFGYAVSEGIIEASPIAKLKLGVMPVRVTYFNVEQEEAVLEHASAEYAALFRFCIMTGARCGEFATLEARHVKINQTPKGEQMTCTLGPSEHKTGSRTGKDRVIRTRCPEVIEMVRAAMARYPKGKLFRSYRGKAWNNGTICSAWKSTLEQIAGTVDMTCEGEPCSTHSTRHTFAKRELWERGKSPQSVAVRMGDTVEMVLKVYGKFINQLEQSIWDDV